MSKKVGSVDAVDRWSFTLMALFIPPLFIMLGANAIGWQWGYWHSFILDNAVFMPLHFFAVGIVRAYNRGEGAGS